MIIPIVGSTASEIKLASSLHLYNELWGLWIMKANFLGMYFLVFHSTFKGLPEAYSEAAKIDGAGNFSILVRIMLPLVRTTFLTIFLINFVQYWNDYSIPFLYLGSRPTVFIPVYYASSGGYTPQALAFVPGKAALAFVALIPTVVIFVIFHKKLLGNSAVGGIKYKEEGL